MAVSYQTFSNETCQLWSYWTEFHKILIQYTGIISAVNALIDVPIPHTISECQSDENGEFAIFCIKSVAMATSSEILKKEVHFDHLRAQKLSFDVKIAKIGSADLEIICVREIIKKD